MTRPTADISASLDGFVTGPDPGPDGPKGWDDTSGYGAGEVGTPAFVVVTSSPPESVRTTGLDWTFITTGLPDAVAAARDRAEAASSDSGKDLDVILMGGGATVGSALDAAGRRADAAPRTHRAGRRDTTVHRRSTAHAGAAERGPGIDRDAPDLRRLAVIR